MVEIIKCSEPMDKVNVEGDLISALDTLDRNLRKGEPSSRSEIRRLIERCKAQLNLHKWQDINTAPENTEVLITWLQVLYNRPSQWFRDIAKKTENGWCLTRYHTLGNTSELQMYWQLLPTEPEQALNNEVTNPTGE